MITRRFPFVFLIIASCWNFEKYDDRIPDGAPGGSSGGDAGNDTETWRTLKLVMTSMAPHPGDFFEYRIVSASNVIVSRGFWDPLGGNDATIVALHAIPPTGGPYRVDFWADQNKNRVLDAPPADHQWRRKLEPTGVDGDVLTIDFVHDFNFEDIQTDSSGNPKVPVEGPAPVTIEFVDAASIVGKLINVRVLNQQAHQVGQYRYQAFPTPGNAPTLLVIPGITEEGTLTTVEVYCDCDGDRAYTPLSRGGGDKTWTFTSSATGSGIHIQFRPGDGSGAAEINDPNL